MKRIFLCAFALFAGVSGGTARAQTADYSPRTTVSLDGSWQIAAGNMDEPPTVFDHTVPVPGLVSLAVPAFDPPAGPPVTDRLERDRTDAAHAAFWYRRTFQMGQVLPQAARLKIQKAMFSTRVILNGILLGDHTPNFTPGYFDVRGALRSGENVLLVRVGADRTDIPSNMPSGFDYEKTRYIPGIFDSVQLILSGMPSIINVQAAPEIGKQTVRVRTVLRNDASSQINLTFLVREVSTGKIVGEDDRSIEPTVAGETSVDVNIPISGCHLWSPEDPFLYRLEVDCGTDRSVTRFGMREFRLDPVSGRAVLNGHPYFMRGANITLYRFFEDSECKDLPWRADWVRMLHQRMKDMRWNCLRYSIGFPPEAWYDIADEVGILIQDEFPLWSSEEANGNELKREYTDWMHERWNHPSVVIWDAQNETRSPGTGEAVAAVRGLDMSDRPWDNGFGLPIGEPTDSYEAHSYFFYKPTTRLADFAHRSQVPFGGPMDDDGRHAVIMNEYGWLWLNRDGTPTTLTKDLYKNLAGENATTEQRRHIFATYLAADTEFWRSHRQTAAVMEFTALGYSRSDGQTSDNWQDVSKLEWEPQFHKYIRDAFAPVGLMVDYWSGTGICGKSATVPVRLINDLGKPWSGAVTLRLKDAGGVVLFEQKQDCHMEPYGQGFAGFEVSWPKSATTGTLEAELVGLDGEPVHSVRDMTIVQASSLGLAFGKRAFASSSWNSSQGPENGVDGDPSTSWSSGPFDPSWLAVDLGEARKISRVRIEWGVEYAPKFSVQVSSDGNSWSEVSSATNSGVPASEARFPATSARYVRVVGTDRLMDKPGHLGNNQRSHAIRELEVFEQ
ncbi:MAG TPA: discoidin domain-containing protein [Opitutaceae bacterium]|nr:discoidin domain-containing protein [Opitutaceae bacterium]